MKRYRRTDEYRAAVHEAGHAVVAWELHVPIKEVSIIPNPERYSLGHVEHTRTEPPKSRLRFPKEIREERNPERREFMEAAYRQTREAENVDYNPESPRLQDWLQKDIMCKFAGGIACALLRIPNPYRGNEGDMCAIGNSSLIAFPGKEETLYLSWLRERTKNILRRRLAAVKALADELMAKKRVSRGLAYIVIAKALTGEVPQVERGKAVASP